MKVARVLLQCGICVLSSARATDLLCISITIAGHALLCPRPCYIRSPVLIRTSTIKSTVLACCHVSLLLRMVPLNVAVLPPLTIRIGPFRTAHATAPPLQSILFPPKRINFCVARTTIDDVPGPDHRLVAAWPATFLHLRSDIQERPLPA